MNIKQKIDSIRFGSRNFETIRHEKMTFEQVTSTFTSERIRSKDGVSVSKSYIPYSDELTKIVYFVDGDNGDSYGQLDTKEKAIELFNLLVSVPSKERGQYDY